MDIINSYESFKNVWLEEITQNSLDTVTKGRRFASKLICQWLDIDEDDPSILFCDGCGDGGIDVAILDSEGTIDDGDGENGFDRWLLVQSKFGTSFSGARTIIDEGRKILDTLRGTQLRGSSISEELRERLIQFRNDAGSSDKIVLVYATVDELSDSERQHVKQIEKEGKREFGDIIETESVSLKTLYEREIGTNEISQKIKIENRMRDFVTISSIKISNYFAFLEKYREASGDIDRLFERNVRKFLPRSKINIRLMETLDLSPNEFAIYNNGITIVCSSSYQSQSNYHVLRNPYVVNGCQTTKTIWQVCNKKLRSGGKNPSEDSNRWKRELTQAEIPIKIVKIKDGDNKLLRNITRYTNTQNAIRESDFIALTDDFMRWAADFEDKYGLFLEIQRGGWDARLTRQRMNSRTMRQLKEMARASDLLKVLGACWYRYPGAALSKNAPFLPGGFVYKEMSPPNSSHAISHSDLLAAFRLQQAAQVRGFGRAARKQSRRATKFLFYFVVGELLRRVFRGDHLQEQRGFLTDTIIHIDKDELMKSRFFDGASDVVDKYLDPSRKQSIFNEDANENNITNLLKSETFGRDVSKLNHLNYHLDIQESMWKELGFWRKMVDLNTASPQP